MIELDGLTKTYGRLVAVQELSLRIGDSEIFAFLGPNGAGKTTTIRMMAGLVRPTSGEARINGLSVQRQGLAAKRILGVVPDRPFLYDKLTGMEFLRFVAGLYHVPMATANRRGARLLDLFDLAGWEDELVEGYSHGMKQRLVMAGAFVHDPMALVVDEPMVGLDPHGARLLKDVLRQFAGLGRTVFLSTHSLPVAEELCHRIAILDEGRLVALGTIDELRERAQTDGDLEAIFLKLTREKSVDTEVAAADALAVVTGDDAHRSGGNRR